MGNFVVKLRGMKIFFVLFNKQLPLNESDNKFDGKLNDINYKRTVMKLYDDGWVFFYFF